MHIPPQLRLCLNKARTAALAAAALVFGAGLGLAGEALSGGATTVFDSTRYAFSLPARNLSSQQRIEFQVGNSFFNRSWVTAPASTAARDGLGPLFNARSCSACHFRDGRGQPFEKDQSPSDSLLLRMSLGDGRPDPHYGGQLGTHAIGSARAEAKVEIHHQRLPGRFADGLPFELQRPIYRLQELAYGSLAVDLRISPRVAPPVFGLGLLEAIPKQNIIARADPEDTDADGISGRASRVWDIRKGAEALGRFGWRAGQPSIRQQSAAALVNDIGITSKFFPDEALTAKQAEEFASFPSGGAPEISNELLERITFYMHTVGVPARRDVNDAEVRRGADLFARIGCAQCHVPEQHTAESYHVVLLAGQTIYPYTDLLLHDMGEGLADRGADDSPSSAKDAREWRTPPLWGIGLTGRVNGHTRFLHDGRARNLQEAILWHGGEGEASREEYRQLPEADRAALLRFLESL